MKQPYSKSEQINYTKWLITQAYSKSLGANNPSWYIARAKLLEYQLLEIRSLKVDGVNVTK